MLLLGLILIKLCCYETETNIDVHSTIMSRSCEMFFKPTLIRALRICLLTRTSENVCWQLHKCNFLCQNYVLKLFYYTDWRIRLHLGEHPGAYLCNVLIDVPNKYIWLINCWLLQFKYEFLERRTSPTSPIYLQKWANNKNNLCNNRSTFITFLFIC